MNNSNLPIGSANSSLAPWNQVYDENIELDKIIYTECCGCEDFTEVGSLIICGDCGLSCSTFEEDESDYNERVNEVIKSINTNNA